MSLRPRRRERAKRWFNDRLIVKWLGRGRHKTTRRNFLVYTVAMFFFGLMIVTVPYLPLVHYDLVTQPVTEEIPFHLVLFANITQNGQTTSATRTFDGQLVLKGRGGISVDNPVEIYAQMTVPSNTSQILSKIDNMTVAPLGALRYPLKNNTNGIPLVEILKLKPPANSSLSGTWSGSDRVIFPRSTNNTILTNVTATDIFGEQSTVYSHSTNDIEVSPVDVTLAINNNLLTTSLTFAILGFAALSFRKDYDRNPKGEKDGQSGGSQTEPEARNPAHSETGKKPEHKGQHRRR